jgi:hypothetical protein
MRLVQGRGGLDASLDAGVARIGKGAAPPSAVCQAVSPDVRSGVSQRGSRQSLGGPIRGLSTIDPERRADIGHRHDIARLAQQAQHIDCRYSPYL